ncbi:MAG: Ig-like domain-containing protein [Candidatus ainarchaeum sp.]|nr:Ig-like domain-containing protein [Candidatus ainarchaeum sp.]
MNNKNINNSHFPKILLSLSLIFFFLLSFGNVFAAPTITVDTLTTNDQTPELTGDISLDGESITSMQLILDGVTYGDSSITRTTTTWTLADNVITSNLSEATYDVAVQMNTSVTGSVTDSTSDELVIDTTAPTVSITLSDYALIVGETSTVTFTFSEAPIGFTSDDVILTDANGTIGEITNEGLVYSGTFTPTDDLEDAENVITVGTSWTDAAGNSPIGTTDSSNYEIDTQKNLHYLLH